MKDENKSVNVICLVTSARGGSKLFHSLLDNHPDIICFPRTFHMTRFLRLINYQLTDSEMISEKFVGNYPRFFDGKIWSKFNKLDKADKLGENSDESFLVDKDLFKIEFMHIYERGEKNTKNLFLSLHFAFHKAKGLKVSNSPSILYHPHDIQYIEELELCVQDYGINNIKVVFTTRHPVDGLNSTLNAYLFQNILSPLNLYYEELSVFTSKISKRFPGIELRVVPLEIMKAYRTDVMKNLCRWSGLQWSDGLLESTLMGKKWLGNAQKDKGDIIYDLSWYYPHGWFEKKDVRIFNTLFPERMKIFGEAFPEKIQNHFWLLVLIVLPMKQEIEVLRRSVSPFYWIKSITRALKDSSSVNNSYDGRVKEQFGKFSYIYMLLRTGNIIRCLVLYMRRVRFTYSLLDVDFSKENSRLLFDPIEYKNCQVGSLTS